MYTLRDKVPNLKASTQPQPIFFSALIKHNKISNNTQAKVKASLKECSINLDSSKISRVDRCQPFN